MLKRGLLLAGLLALGACSEVPFSPTEDPDLTTQRISTSGDDSVVAVAVYRGSGAVYALSQTDRSDASTGRSSQYAFLRRYSRSGAVVWRRQLGTSDLVNASDLATDPGGSLYVSYNEFLSNRSTVEKRRGDGSLVWSRELVDADAGGVVVSAIETDKNGNLYVGGHDSFASETLILRKYTAAGSLVWTRRVDGSGIAYTPSGIATDASGNVYMVANDVDDDYFSNSLLKYSPGGRLLINRTIDAGSLQIRLNDVVVQGSDLYLGGTRFEDDDDRPARADGVLVKLSLGGAEQWRRVVGTPEPDGVSDLAADASGLYLTGSTNGNLGGVYNGGSDVFLRKYTSGGQVLWTKQIGSPGDDGGNTVAAYSPSELYLGGGAGGALADTAHRGGQDGFLRRTDGQGNRVWTDQ